METRDAKDEGLTIMACRSTWAGRWCLKVGEKRRLAIDFAGLDELDTEGLTGTPTVVMVTAGSGVVISGAAISGTKVTFWADAAAGVAGDYEASVAIGTTGGANLKRTGTIRVE